MCLKSSGYAVELPAKPAAGAWKLFWVVVAVISALGAVGRLAAALPPPLLLDVVNAMLAALALGWIFRLVIHGAMGYFVPKADADGGRYGLVLASVLDTAFAILWLSATIMLFQHPDPLLTSVAIALSSALAFLLSLWTLSAARKRDHERGCEWIRARFRKGLEPGRKTWPGWVLVSLIDWRSDEDQLSTFVAGTLAGLLIGLTLIAISLFGGTAEHPDEKNNTQQPSLVATPRNS